MRSWGMVCRSLYVVRLWTCLWWMCVVCAAASTAASTAAAAAAAVNLSHLFCCWSLFLLVTFHVCACFFFGIRSPCCAAPFGRTKSSRVMLTSNQQIHKSSVAITPGMLWTTHLTFDARQTGTTWATTRLRLLLFWRTCSVSPPPLSAKQRC